MHRKSTRHRRKLTVAAPEDDEHWGARADVDMVEHTVAAKAAEELKFLCREIQFLSSLKHPSLNTASEFFVSAPGPAPPFPGPPAGGSAAGRPLSGRGCLRPPPAEPPPCGAIRPATGVAPAGESEGIRESTLYRSHRIHRLHRPRAPRGRRAAARIPEKVRGPCRTATPPQATDCALTDCPRTVRAPPRWALRLGPGQRAAQNPASSALRNLRAATGSTARRTRRRSCAGFSAGWSTSTSATACTAT